LPYRTTTETPLGTGELVTYRTYLEPVDAQLARARLAAEGIEAHVLDEGIHNVIMPGSASGIRLQVPEGDLARVHDILREHPWERPRDDGEGSGVVRCPRCELAYCFHERMNVEGHSAAAALSFFETIFMMRSPKRWHCHKCGHVWDNPREGPAEMTTLDASDPRPVFRLRRTHAGMGVFLGLAAGAFAAVVGASALPRDMRSLAPLALLCAPLVGWLIGRSLRYDICSEPACRAPLAPDREDCPRCDGQIAGVIRAADEHYAASADFRRELAALRAKDGAPRKKKKKPSAARS
jgi:hypothetical protein